MAVPGTGSTNQSLTIASFKKLAGKAHTSNLKEFYEETIPSNVQLKTDIIFGESIPQTVSTSTLYTTFSASASDPVTVEYVEFDVESISGTSYDANAGTFGDVGFGGGDEAQGPGPHGFKLSLRSYYENSSSYVDAGTGHLVNGKTINETNGGLQLVNPSFGPQSGNNYGLSLYTDHPDEGGTLIVPTNAIDWYIDYFNGVVFIQDYRSDFVPTYARGFIYVGKFAKELINEASGSGSGIITALNNQTENRLVTIGSTTTELDGEANLTFDGSTLELTGTLAVNGESSFENTASFNAPVNLNEHVSLDQGKKLYFDGTLSDSGQGPFIHAASATQFIIDGDNQVYLRADNSLFVQAGTSNTVVMTLTETALTSSVNTRINGDLTTTGQVSASTYYGDGSNLTGINVGISYSRTAVTTTITSSVSDSILGVSGTAPIDIRLPGAEDFDAGQYFTVKDESGAANIKNITILASGSQTIDGRPSVTLESPYAAVNIYSDGTSKFFIY